MEILRNDYKNTYLMMLDDWLLNDIFKMCREHENNDMLDDISGRSNKWMSDLRHDVILNYVGCHNRSKLNIDAGILYLKINKLLCIRNYDFNFL